MSSKPTSRPTTRPARGRRVELAHSRIVFELSPAGVMARIENGERVAYAGPLDKPTIDAILEVGEQ